MHDYSATLIELGSAFVGLALLCRAASACGLSPIPLYLLAGLAVGKGGLAPMDLSQNFIGLGAEIGVLLLLFMMGLEYSGEELKTSLKQGLPSGLLDFVLNFPPGLIAGFLLGWQPIAALLLGGATWVSSSGIIAKVLAETKRASDPESKSVLSVLVLEDLAMALYLPFVSVLVAGGTADKITTSVAIATTAVLLILVGVMRFGSGISKLLSHESDEIILLTTFGIVLLVAGIAHGIQVSEAIGAFLVGIAMCGTIAHQSHRLFMPLRDLFAAMFFFFFGMEVDPHSLPPVLLLAVALGLVTALTKFATGWFAAKGATTDARGRIRAGLALIPRGEFSIVIAGLGATLQPELGPLSAAYVLFLAIVGPIALKLAK
ncbi:MAG TPA: cation:proton antiporter [Candidatus Obscuribacterales bacterium]